MASERYVTENLQLPPTDWLQQQREYLVERFQGAEARIEAVQMVVDMALGTLPEANDDEKMLRVGEFFESVGKPPPMIADGILAPNEVLLVSARPKHGKSFLMLQMADDIASGRPLFGKWELERSGPVVYLAMEGSKYRFRERIERRGMHERNPEVYVYHARRDLSTAKGIAWLIEQIEPIQPALVIVDTARQAFRLDDWNNPSIIQMRLGPFVEAVQRNGPLKFPEGTACTIIHHNNKNPNAEGGDKISGSNAFQGIVDNYIILDKKRRHGNGDLQVEAEFEGRIDMPDKVMFLMNSETLEVRVVEENEAASFRAQSMMESLQKHFPTVQTALQQNGGSQSAADLERHTGITKSFLSRVLREAVEAGAIVKTGTKKAGRGSPVTLYGLPTGFNSSLNI